MAAADAGKPAHTAPHALQLPYPAQGHVIPFMELADRLLDRGFAVTFVNTEFNHRRVVAAAGAGAPGVASAGGRPRLVAVADGMSDGEHRDDFVRLNACIQEAIPPQLDALLDADDERLGRVTCVVVDVSMSWALDAAKRRGLPAAALWPASAAVFAVLIGAKKLIRDGVIDYDGAPVKLENNTFRLADSMPAMDAVFLAWNYMGNRDVERMVFHYLTTTAWAAVAKADVVLCNTFEDLEPDIFGPDSPATTVLPIGPLRTWQRRTSAAPAGHFWRADDAACMAFLDAQPHGSVAYVAFGSLAVMSPAQLQELALALLASTRPFLWVFRPGLAAAELPAAFADLLPRHGKRGKVVEWASQERVLAHPAVGCYALWVELDA